MTIETLYQSEELLDQANAAREAGNLSQAETLYKQALEKRKASVGDADPSVAHYMDCLGLVQMAQNQSAEAEAMFKGAVEILEQAYYAGHGKIGPILEHLAELYCKQNKQADAEPVMKRALEINDKCLSGDHRITLESMYKLAVLQHKLGKNADAETVINKALKSLDSPLGPSEEFKYELAQIKEEDGKLPEAQDLYRHALVGFEQRRNLPRLAECLESYARCLRKDKKNADADKAEAAAKQIREIAKNFSWQHDIFSATLLRA